MFRGTPVKARGGQSCGLLSYYWKFLSDLWSHREFQWIPQVSKLVQCSNKPDPPPVQRSGEDFVRTLTDSSGRNTRRGSMKSQTHGRINSLQVLHRLVYFIYANTSPQELRVEEAEKFAQLGAKLRNKRVEHEERKKEREVKYTDRALPPPKRQRTSASCRTISHLLSVVAHTTTQGDNPRPNLFSTKPGLAQLKCKRASMHTITGI